MSEPAAPLPQRNDQKNKSSSATGRTTAQRSCARSNRATRVRSLRCARFCARSRQATGSIAAICRASPTSSTPPASSRFSSTAASGMDTIARAARGCPRPTPPIGAPRSLATGRATKRPSPPMPRWAGARSSSTNANSRTRPRSARGSRKLWAREGGLGQRRCRQTAYLFGLAPKSAAVQHLNSFANGCAQWP